MFDVSPPKPCRYVRGSSRARLVELDHRLAERDDVERRQSRMSAARGSARKRGGVARARAYARTARAGSAPGVYRFEPVPKPFAPAAQYGARLSGLMPPTANTSVSRGSTARHAFSARRRQRLGGKHLEAVGAGGERGERLGRRRDAGHADQAEPLRLAR